MSYGRLDMSTSEIDEAWPLSLFALKLLHTLDQTIAAVNDELMKKALHESEQDHTTHASHPFFMAITKALKIVFEKIDRYAYGSLPMSYVGEDLEEYFIKEVEAQEGGRIEFKSEKLHSTLFSALSTNKQNLINVMLTTYKKLAYFRYGLVSEFISPEWLRVSLLEEELVQELTVLEEKKITEAMLFKKADDCVSEMRGSLKEKGKYELSLSKISNEYERRASDLLSCLEYLTSLDLATVHAQLGSFLNELANVDKNNPDAILLLEQKFNRLEEFDIASGVVGLERVVETFLSQLRYEAGSPIDLTKEGFDTLDACVTYKDYIDALAKTLERSNQIERHKKRAYELMIVAANNMTSQDQVTPDDEELPAKINLEILEERRKDIEEDIIKFAKLCVSQSRIRRNEIWKQTATTVITEFNVFFRGLDHLIKQFYDYHEVASMSVRGVHLQAEQAQAIEEYLISLEERQNALKACIEKANGEVQLTKLIREGNLKIERLKEALFVKLHAYWLDHQDKLNSLISQFQTKYAPLHERARNASLADPGLTALFAQARRELAGVKKSCIDRIPIKKGERGLRLDLTPSENATPTLEAEEKEKAVPYLSFTRTQKIILFPLIMAASITLGLLGGALLAPLTGGASLALGLIVGGIVGAAIGGSVVGAGILLTHYPKDNPPSRISTPSTPATPVRSRSRKPFTPAVTSLTNNAQLTAALPSLPLSLSPETPGQGNPRQVGENEQTPAQVHYVPVTRRISPLNKTPASRPPTSFTPM